MNLFLPPNMYLSNTLQQNDNIDYQQIKTQTKFFDEDEY